MVPENTIYPKPIALLPSTDPRLLRAAADVALLAGGLMDSVKAPLLALAVPSDRWGGATPMVLWNDRLMPCEDKGRAIVETPMFAPAIDALCLAADALFARLEAWRWAHSGRPGLCAVTDGTGVFLTHHRPGPDAGAGWLLDLARLDGAAIPLLPLAENGVWSLIAAEAGAVH